MADPMTPEQWAEKLRVELNLVALDYGHDDIVSVHANEVATLTARFMAEFRDAAREQLAAFVPPGALAPGETPALCATCTDRLCVPGLPGCARCTKAELQRLRSELDDAAHTRRRIERESNRMGQRIEQGRAAAVVYVERIQEAEAERDEALQRAERAEAVLRELDVTDYQIHQIVQRLAARRRGAEQSRIQHARTQTTRTDRDGSTP
ncbi:hypothetical protein [Actinomadura sp. GTD37]|uniref:hypothetical protein n=1 Tax=Actinomadura sp. GTD37 TaxID=1778030 RepID=UPI0035BEBCC3